jgi:hypothetical protein
MYSTLESPFNVPRFKGFPLRFLTNNPELFPSIPQLTSQVQRNLKQEHNTCKYCITNLTNSKLRLAFGSRNSLSCLNHTRDSGVS